MTDAEKKQFLEYQRLKRAYRADPTEANLKARRDYAEKVGMVENGPAEVFDDEPSVAITPAELAAAMQARAEKGDKEGLTALRALAKRLAKKPQSADQGEVRVGESWYDPAALEWITEGRNLSGLTKVKRIDRNGVSRYVYVRSGGDESAKSGQGERSRPPMEHPIDQKAAAEFASTGRAAAFRVQDNRKPLPKESGNHWTDGEGETMGGVSGHANLSNAVADLLFGERESVTGENYSNNIREDGGEPQIVVLSGRQIDAPGSEIVVPNPKIAAVISQQQLQDWFKPIARQILKNAGGDQAAIDDVDRLTPAEISDKYSFDKRDMSDVQDHIEKSIRDYVSNITLQLSQSSAR